MTRRKERFEQGQLFPSEDPVAAHLELMRGFVAEQLRRTRIESDNSLMKTFVVLSVAAESLARKLAEAHGMDPDTEEFDEFFMTDRILLADEDDGAFDIDINHDPHNEFYGNPRIINTPEVQMLTTRAMSMARIVVDEVYIDSRMAEVVQQ